MKDCLSDKIMLPRVPLSLQSCTEQYEKNFRGMIHFISPTGLKKEVEEKG